MLLIRGMLLFGVSVSVLLSLATATHGQTVTKHKGQYSKSPIEFSSEWHAWKEQHGKTYRLLCEVVLATCTSDYYCLCILYTVPLRWS